MTIFGVDIHPQYQAGISIEQIRAEGFDFMACKVSESTGRYDSISWLQRGRACGLLSLGYHFLRPGNEDAQAQIFVDQITKAGVPGMLDAEAVDAQGHATLTIGGIFAFVERVKQRGAKLPLLYLPRWYWQRIGSPNLTGLPTLWASSYPSTQPGFASILFNNVGQDRWSSYGGNPVSVLQFTDKGIVAGRQIDCNAFLGTRDDFAATIDVNRVDPAPPPPPGPETIPDMNYGERSTNVLHLQQFMTNNFRSYNAYEPTGYYGDQTASGLKEFQRRIGIIGGDGRNVGPQTKRGLWQYGFKG